MRSCPSCGEPGIREHSVLVPIASLTGDRASSDDERSTYARCARCDAIFRHAGPLALVPQPADALDEPTVWLIPPWKTRGDEAAFEMSWDVVEAFYEDQAIEIDWVRPLGRLVSELRSAGLDSQLRAGQSLNSLGLSRSREHGLRPEQSHLFLSPQTDGSVVIEGVIGAERVKLGPVAPTLQGPLRSIIDELLSVSID